jgi:hypothetical protein
MIGQVPSSLNGFSSDMLPFKLISHLASSVKCLPYPTCQDEVKNLRQRCKEAELAQNVLVQLVEIANGNRLLVDIANTSRWRGSSARGRRRSEATARTRMEVDCNTFIELGFRVPQDTSEAADMAAKVLSNQKDNLKVVSDSLHA